MFEWLKKLFAGSGQAHASPAMITRTCKSCGKTFTLPEDVQSWPDLCVECRAKRPTAEPITRACRRCGKPFTFLSSEKSWPKYCPNCRRKR